MVKADFTRDYYGDLNLTPAADVQEIKKQFKKLALTYHPDRNPGRESQVTAQFQLIQSAHEVLTDTQERAKYDANRRNATYNPYYGGPTSSGVRGNPWQNAGSQFPPPPKPSGTRRTAPPPSEGAKRYQQFNNAAPKATQYSAQEGAEARRNTYAAWEHMKPDHTRSKPAPTRATPGRKPAPPPRQTPNAGNTPGVSPQRKGFMPNTPGGDEPAAPRGAYFTTQRAAPEPPPVPPRNPSPINPSASNTYAGTDPLNQFRDQRPHVEPRTSTPYATHGGEKFNLHESANIGRSKSTREPVHTKDVPRTGSDPNLGSPLRTRSTAERTSTRTRKPAPATFHIESEDSSSDDLLFTTSGAFGKPRAKPPVNRATPLTQTVPNATQGSANPRKPSSNLRTLRQWMMDNPSAEYPLNGFPIDPPPRMDSTQQNGKSDEAKMYDKSERLFTPSYPKEKKHPLFLSDSDNCNIPKVSETFKSSDGKASSKTYGYSTATYQTLFTPGEDPATPPSGGAKAFEELQRSVIDGLLSNKQRNTLQKNQTAAPGEKDAQGQKFQTPHNVRSSSDQWHTYREAEGGSPLKKPKPQKHLHSVRLDSSSKARVFWENYEQLKTSNANPTEKSSFTFNVNDDTFQRTGPASNGFASSKAENITTTFTQESWGKDKFDGVFEAGYFNPVKKPPTSPTRGRAKNGSRSRSPNKVRPIPIPPMEPQATTDAAEDMMESPGGTKFQKNAWQGVFKPATFAPIFTPTIPPPGSTRPANKKTRTTSARPTMGTAAVVNDGEISDHKPLFDAKPTAPSTFRHPPSPDAMDVDPPPVNSAHTVPKFVPGTVNGDTASLSANGTQLNGNVQRAQRPKRPATHSQSPVEADTESLKVDLQDLKIKDINELVTDLNLPAPPPAPDSPPPPTMTESISKAAQDKYLKQFEIYMRDWDLFNTKIMIHFFARKNQGWNSTGWEDDSKIENYREALRVDSIVDKHWHNARELHEKVMKDYVVIKERMRMRAEFEGIH